MVVCSIRYQPHSRSSTSTVYHSAHRNNDRKKSESNIKNTTMTRNQQPIPHRCVFGAAAAKKVATAVVLALLPGASSTEASATAVIPPPSSCVRVTDAAFSPSCVPGAHEASFVFSMEGVTTTRPLFASTAVSAPGGGKGVRARHRRKLGWVMGSTQLLLIVVVIIIPGVHNYCQR